MTTRRPRFAVPAALRRQDLVQRAAGRVDSSPTNGRPRVSPPRWCASTISRRSRHRHLSPGRRSLPARPGQLLAARREAAGRCRASSRGRRCPPRRRLLRADRAPQSDGASPPPWSAKATASSRCTTRRRACRTSSATCAPYSMSAGDLRVLSPFMGGGFGSGLRPQYQAVLAVLGTLALKRSVRVVLTRPQMYALGHRPGTIERIALGAKSDGALDALTFQAIAMTSQYEAFARRDGPGRRRSTRSPTRQSPTSWCASICRRRATCADRAPRAAFTRSNAPWMSLRSH